MIHGYVDTMLAVDYLIMNRDRHGANIEVLRNARKRTIRIAPLKQRWKENLDLHH